MNVAPYRGRFGSAMTILAGVGLAIGSYLLVVRILGEAPACGPIQGCDTVAASEFATLFGLPMALYGVGFSIVLLGACMTWWRLGERRALYAAYGLGLAGIIAVAYLTYLELFVIEAMCVWCVTYAVTIVAGWVIATIAAWRTADR